MDTGHIDVTAADLDKGVSQPGSSSSSDKMSTPAGDPSAAPASSVLQTPSARMRAVAMTESALSRPDDGRYRFFGYKTTWSVDFMNLLHYLVFLTMIVSVTLGRPTIFRYHMHTALHDRFVVENNPAKGTVSYEHIHNKALYFKWMEEVFVPAMFPGIVSPENSTAIIETAAYRLGKVRFRQLRVEKDSCKVSRKFRRAVDRCHAKFEPKYEDVEQAWIDGGEEYGWAVEGELTEEQVAEVAEGGFGWTSEKDMTTGTYYSSMTKASYEGSGYEYYMDVGGADDPSFKLQLQHLKNKTYVDFATRLVSQDFTLYNPAVDMLVWGSHTSEFLPTGDVVPTFHYRIYDEWKYLR
jgi:hypothetical protein